MDDTERTLQRLEERLQALEAATGIRECLARYCFTVDSSDYGAYAENFTEDGTIDIDAYLGTHFSGREGIRRFVEDPDGVHATIAGRCFHSTQNLIIRAEGSAGWAEGHSFVIVRENDGFRVFSCGFNHWEFEKAGDRWLLKSRRRRAVGDARAGAVFSHYAGIRP